MSRSIWKGPFVDPSLLKKVEKLKSQSRPTPIKTWSRKSTIIPEFVGISFLIHNGSKFIPIKISEEMVGHKLGEFSPTRQFSGHTPADKKAAQEAAALALPLSGNTPDPANGADPLHARAGGPWQLHSVWRSRGVLGRGADQGASLQLLVFRNAQNRAVGGHAHPRGAAPHESGTGTLGAVSPAGEPRFGLCAESVGMSGARISGHRPQGWIARGVRR